MHGSSFKNRHFVAKDSLKVNNTIGRVSYFILFCINRYYYLLYILYYFTLFYIIFSHKIFVKV